MGAHPDPQALRPTGLCMPEQAEVCSFATSSLPIAGCAFLTSHVPLEEWTLDRPEQHQSITLKLDLVSVARVMDRQC